MLKISIDQIKSLLKSEFVKFIFVGGINTLSTYLIYLILILFLQYQIAFTLAYLSGIIISFFLNSKVVFRVEISLKKFFRYPSVYVIQYLMNLLLLYISVDILFINKQVAPLIAIIITLPVTFTISRFILKREPIQFQLQDHA